ncbi:intradiol ring-cleavage dioxygenase [Thalassolituus sp. LLYu03]|uniref:dioxygenase family protein n=1 Tax=Thalassolituus sp. LLYu03 TaxID=3421656 RepID=UPI003D2D8169
MNYKSLALSRRKLLTTAGSYLAAVPFLGLAGCGGDDSTIAGSVGDSTSTTGSGSETSTTVDTSTGWASGGTDLITVDYPADTLFDGSSTCSVTMSAQTEGPCYFGVSESEDIAEGQTGLPMQLCLQFVDEDCNPLEGYLIEVWHCNRSGVYSGDTSDSDDSARFAGDYCTGNNSAAEASTWFRGELTTDSSGRVNFKSCFPGWYSGRTIHIHFRIRKANGGSDYLISQFCFDDSFTEEICTTHAKYSSRGIQDTTLSGGRDTIFGSDYSEYLMNLQQNSDGSLLAYKRVVVSA